MADLPVDVVIAHKPSRAEFFNQFVLPAVKAQNPSRIIIMDGPGGLCAKRNGGVAMATAPYALLLDGDIIVSGGYLKKAIEVLESNPLPVAYVYSDWIQVPLPGCMDPPVTQAQYVHVPEFHNLPLYDRGGVDCPVLRRETFRPFDIKVKRYTSWDWSLSMKKAGYIGKKIAGFNMISFMMDRGITTGTSVEDSAEARIYIQKKHGITS